MRMKILIGAAMAALLVGIGALVGSVVGASGVFAQSPTAQATATPSTPSTAPTPGTTTPYQGKRMMHGEHGMFGGWGFGPGFGFGKGAWDGMATADGANTIISKTASLLDLVKGDLSYATGKMDTADVQRWLNSADSLLQQARTANSNAQYGPAVAYSSAAAQLAMIARSQMAQKLGEQNLPSHGQLAGRGWGHGPKMPGLKTPDTSSVTFTQAQASRILAGTYYRLKMQASVVSGSGSAWLTEAQNAYKSAYSAYQAGNYNEAVTYARLAEQLAGVATTVTFAPGAPANQDTPVTVPAPNF